MTRLRHDDKGTEFGDWLRTEYQQRIGSHTFSAQNLDYIWHNYKENWFILIEEKRYGGMSNKFAEMAQTDTHGVLHQLLLASSGKQVVTQRGIRGADYRGYYKLVFSGTGPGDSEWCTVNGQRVSKETLLHLLETGTLEGE